MVVTFKTKTEAVYEKLRHDIIDGKLKPGQKIVISDLSKECGFSEIPIREAIRSLESEGLVQVTPHVGTIVTKIDGKEVTEIYLIRIELESLASKLATPYVTNVDLAFLNKKNQEMELAASRHKYEKLGSLNKDFHLRIYCAAPYPFLFRLIVDLWEKVQRTQCVFALNPKRAISAIEEHKRIIEALRRKDADLVGRLVREQKKSSMEALMGYSERNNESVMQKQAAT